MKKPPSCQESGTVAVELFDGVDCSVRGPCILLRLVLDRGLEADLIDRLVAQGWRARGGGWIRERRFLPETARSVAVAAAVGAELSVFVPADGVRIDLRHLEAAAPQVLDVMAGRPFQNGCISAAMQFFKPGNSSLVEARQMAYAAAGILLRPTPRDPYLQPIPRLPREDVVSADGTVRVAKQYAERSMLFVQACPYCGGTVSYVAEPRPAWQCDRSPECDAKVGVHRGTTVPLGRLANSHLRRLRVAVHDLIDRFWKSETLTRNDVYCRMASFLRLPPREFHVGFLDEQQCQQVLAKLSPFSAALPEAIF